MRLLRSTTALTILFAMLFIDALVVTAASRPDEEPTAPALAQRGGRGQAARGGRGGRGRGRRRGVSTMTVALTAWTDGGQIPSRYSQVGPETSPGVAWSNVPQGTESFVLVFRDLDAPTGNGMNSLMHWLLWNVPGTSMNIPQDLAEGFELDNGTRQISASGPRYRGPGAMAGGSIHHYVMEVYALDAMLDVEVIARIPRGSSPADNARDAVFEAMNGHVLGKGVYTGLYRRSR